MNVVLIGMRGSGKSTVAKMLAQRLNWQYLEFDDEIAKKVGTPIADMVAQEGWDHFRDIESIVVEEAADLDNVVMSTGGGVILRDKNVAALKRNGICIFLHAPLEALLKHIGGEDSKLPRLTNQGTMQDEIETVWKIREPLYRKAADEIIETEKLDLQGVVEEIVQRLQKRNIVA